jgi:hypothetical protein
MSLRFHLLANTRSKSFDYAWVRGLADRAFESELIRFLQSWLDNTQLNDLPPVTVFFPFKKRCVLLAGCRSEIRKDGFDRPIFERVLLVWDGQEQVRYSHLLPLRRRLEKEAKAIFSSVPDNVVDPPRKQYYFDLDWDDLEEPQKGGTDAWSLPFGLTPQDLVRAGLTVEVPADWTFAKMLVPLGDAVIDSVKAVCIGHSLTLKHRGDRMGAAWLISGTTSDNGNLPQVRDANGNIMDRAGIERLRVRWAEDATRAVKSQQRSEPAEKKSAPPAPQPQAESEASPQDFQEAVHLSQQLAPQEQGLFRRSANNGIPVCVRRLHFLISPAGRLIGQDVLIAWQMLLQEILLCHEIASPGIAEEWIRRLRTLQRLVINPGRPYPHDWSPELHSAYNQLYDLLDKVRYRSR